VAAYYLVWEFETDEARRPNFEAVYGPAGLWVEFFRKGEGYLGSELFRDVRGGCRYITVDRWASRVAYEAFRSRFAAEYAAIDARCEALTVRETFLGDREHST